MQVDLLASDRTIDSYCDIALIVSIIEGLNRLSRRLNGERTFPRHFTHSCPGVKSNGNAHNLRFNSGDNSDYRLVVFNGNTACCCVVRQERLMTLLITL